MLPYRETDSVFARHTQIALCLNLSPPILVRHPNVLFSERCGMRSQPGHTWMLCWAIIISYSLYEVCTHIYGVVLEDYDSTAATSIHIRRHHVAVLQPVLCTHPMVHARCCSGIVPLHPTLARAPHTILLLEWGG